MAAKTTSEPAKRVMKLQAALRRHKFDAMVVHDPFNVFYLTGFHASLAYLLVTPRGARLLVDGRYIEAARKAVTHCEVELFKKIGESFGKWWKDFTPARIGFEGSIAWSAREQFGEWINEADWAEAGGLLLDLRAVKSPGEVKLLEASARLNDEIYESTVNSLLAGMTEFDVRNLIRAEADRRGAEGLSFDVIVSTGVTCSMPHYSPAHRPLESGDLLLIDMGMLLNGYCSDMTRVVALGKPPGSRLRRVFGAVLEAELAGLAAAKPGVKTRDVYLKSQAVLKKHKLARYFTHGLGHGVGLEIHENPRLNNVSEEVLEPGMIITIEPGVYLPGVGGVRIEDMAVVTKTGCRSLSKARKEFRVVNLG